MSADDLELEELIEELLTLAYYSQWAEAKQLAESHQDQLVSEEANTVIDALIAGCDPEEYYDSMRIDDLKDVQALLTRCRHNGLDAVFAPLLAQEQRNLEMIRVPLEAKAQLLNIHSTADLDALLLQHPVLQHSPGISYATTMQFLYDVMRSAATSDAESSYSLIKSKLVWVYENLTQTINDWKYQTPFNTHGERVLAIEGLTALGDILGHCPYGDREKNVELAQACQELAAHLATT